VGVSANRSVKDPKAGGGALSGKRETPNALEEAHLKKTLLKGGGF